MSPAAGHSSSYMPRAASGDSSRNGEPGSSRCSSRSRGSSLPRARWRWRAGSGPPSAARAQPGPQVRDQGPVGGVVAARTDRTRDRRRCRAQETPVRAGASWRSRRGHRPACYGRATRQSGYLKHRSPSRGELCTQPGTPERRRTGPPSSWPARVRPSPSPSTSAVQPGRPPPARRRTAARGPHLDLHGEQPPHARDRGRRGADRAVLHPGQRLPGARRSGLHRQQLPVAAVLHLGGQAGRGRAGRRGPARAWSGSSWRASTRPAGPWEPYEDAVAAWPADQVPDERLGAAMLYSSGTTGQPKGILRPPARRGPRRAARQSRSCSSSSSASGRA